MGEKWQLWHVSSKMCSAEFLVHISHPSFDSAPRSLLQSASGPVSTINKQSKSQGNVRKSGMKSLLSIYFIFGISNKWNVLLSTLMDGDCHSYLTLSITYTTLSTQWTCVIPLNKILLSFTEIYHFTWIKFYIAFFLGKLMVLKQVTIWVCPFLFPTGDCISYTEETLALQDNFSSHRPWQGSQSPDTTAINF